MSKASGESIIGLAGDICELSVHALVSVCFDKSFLQGPFVPSLKTFLSVSFVWTNFPALFKASFPVVISCILLHLSCLIYIIFQIELLQVRRQQIFASLNAFTHARLVD